MLTAFSFVQGVAFGTQKSRVSKRAVSSNKNKSVLMIERNLKMKHVQFDAENLSPTECVELIASLLKEKSNFSEVKARLIEGTCLASSTYLFNGLEAVLGDDLSVAVAHLLLDACLASQQPEASSQAELEHGAQLFLTYLDLSQPRLAAKLAGALHLTIEDFQLNQRSRVVDAISTLLDASPANGVALLLQFPNLADHFDLHAIIESLVASGQESTAMRFISNFHFSSLVLQSAYVEACMLHDRLKAASKAVKTFNLVESYPNVEEVYKKRTLEKLVNKGIWGVASNFVGENDELRHHLLMAMAVAGEASFIVHLCSLWNLDPAEFAVDSKAVDLEREKRRGKYLQVPDYLEIHVIDSSGGLEGITPTLEGLLQDIDKHPPPAIGVDVEWKPDIEGTYESSSPASLLQISTDDHVFVIDLLALARPPLARQLSAALRPLLLEEKVYKLGCGLTGDLKKLALSYPFVDAFRSVHGCIDLSALWRDRHMQPGTIKRVPESYRKRSMSVGLSALTEAMVGKPLDKTMQMSNWERRPLSTLQLNYAALDAHASVLIFRGFGEMHHAFSTHQGLVSGGYAFNWTFSAPGVQPGKNVEWRRDETDEDGDGDIDTFLGEGEKALPSTVVKSLQGNRKASGGGLGNRRWILPDKTHMMRWSRTCCQWTASSRRLLRV